MIMRVSSLYIMVMILTGCGIPLSFSPIEHYRLQLPAITADSTTTEILPSISVDHPDTTSLLDTYRVALLKQDNTHEYYADVRWPNFLASAVQSALVTSLRNTEAFEAVSKDDASILPTYKLVIAIEQFEMDYTAGDLPIAHVNLHFSLVYATNNKVIDSFGFSKLARAEGQGLKDIQKAFIEAFEDAQQTAIEKIFGALKKEARHDEMGHAL